MSDRSIDRPTPDTQAVTNPVGAPFRPPQREAFRPTPPGRAPTPPVAAAARPSRAATGGEHKRLLVGREIELSGAISACDTLVVEGRVETDLSDAVTIEVSQTGVFKGKATVDHADIAGVFEGELIVRKKLTVARSGRVVGTVRYATLEVEAGGKLSGTLEPLDEPAPDVHHRPPRRPEAGTDEDTGGKDEG